ERLRRHAVAGHDPEEQVLGADLRESELAGDHLGSCDRLLGLVAEALDVDHSHHSWGSLASIERTLALVQAPHRHCTPRSPMSSDQPSGMPSSGPSPVTPHRAQWRLIRATIGAWRTRGSDPPPATATSTVGCASCSTRWAPPSTATCCSRSWSRRS